MSRSKSLEVFPGAEPDAIRTRFRQPVMDFIGASGVAIAAAIVYGLTVQPTLSFWDCGEFIACAVTLGIPHPPGAPLFVLVGRLFALLPTAADIGLRVNLVSVVTSALAVGLAYLITVRMARRWVFDGQAFWGQEAILFTVGLCGAGMLGFGRTVWTNAIEAEVYGVTLVLFLAILYIALVWIDARDEVRRIKLLVLAVYVGGIGLGAHMMVFLALPTLWLIAFLLEPSYRKDARAWLAAVATMAIMVTGVEAYLWNLSLLLTIGIFRLSVAPRVVRRVSGWIVPAAVVLLYVVWQSTLPLRVAATSTPFVADPHSWFAGFGWSTIDWLITLLVAAAVTIVCFRPASVVSTSRSGWVLLTGVTVAALAAFTLQAYMPVRSVLDPRIDENDPESWRAFVGFLERKQYGRESMVERMFRRRGSWAHQLGRHPRMGFWSFFENQWGLKSGPHDLNRPEQGTRSPAFLLLFILGLFGVGYLCAVYWRIGVPIWVTLLLTTVGLVFYMNFADGTRFNPNAVDQAYLEVRDRDYFFTTGFALFGICVGLGVAAFLRVFLEPRKRLWKPILVLAASVFIFALPVKTIWANYWMQNRSRDYIPYDYAHNMLSSCAPDAILFTNGDNDTFPLWCLQEAYGVRTDICIVNLSLANTHWYIHQLKSRLGVPFELQEEEIDRLRPHPRLGRVQDQVINIVLESNRWNRPVYFGASTPQSSRKYRGELLDANLRMEGMVMRLVRESGERQVNRALTLRRYLQDYRFRGLNDPTIHKDEATRRIADNYATGLLFVADAYRREQQVDSARIAATLAARLRPELDQPVVYLIQLAGDHEWTELADSLLASATGNLRADLYYNYGLASEKSGRSAIARRAYDSALAVQPRHSGAFSRAVGLLYQAGDYPKLVTLLDQWMAANPDDTLGPMLKAEVEAMRRVPMPADTGLDPSPQEGGP